MFPVQKLKNVMILINLMFVSDEHWLFSLKPIGVTKLVGFEQKDNSHTYSQILVSNSKLPTFESIGL